MRRVLSIVFSFVVSVVLSVFPVGSAAALGSEWLGCSVSPGAEEYVPNCDGGGIASPDYTVEWQVRNRSGDYTYEWVMSVPHSDGCAPTTYWCRVLINSFMGTTYLEAQVRIIQNGRSLVLDVSRASVPAVCWVDGTPVLC